VITGGADVTLSPKKTHLRYRRCTTSERVTVSAIRIFLDLANPFSNSSGDLSEITMTCNASLFTTVLILALVSWPGNVVGSGIHKWVDANGQVHFGDKPPENVRSQQVKVTPNIYAKPSIEALEDPPPATESVVLYSTTWCGHCKRARSYFQNNGIAFTEYDVETSARGKADYTRLGARGVPIILVGDKRMNGFSPESFEQLYASAKR